MNNTTELGTPIVSLTHWTAVPLYWLDSARTLTDAERVKALAEYRSTGGMHLVVMAEPSVGDCSPEEAERLSSAGPTPDEIDWTGFGPNAAEELEARIG